ncbi:MAG: flagellar hook-length control protein FliK [Syntrophaceae bacterium]
MNSGSNENQSTAQGVSKNIGKQAKGKKNKTSLFDLIGGTGSFADVLKQKSALPGVQGKHINAEGSGEGINKLNAGHDKIETGSTGIKNNNGHVSRKEMSGKMIPNITGEEDVGDDNAVILSDKLNIQDGMAGQIKFSENKDIKVSLTTDSNKIVNAEKSISKTLNNVSGEKTGNLETLLNEGLKGNKFTKKNINEEMNAFRISQSVEDHMSNPETDTNKGFDIKGSISKNISSDIKGSEIKTDQRKKETSQDNIFSTNQLNREGEKTLNNANTISDGFKLERSVEKGFREIPAIKTDTTLVTAPTDLSGIKGILGNTEISTKGNITTPVQFQDVFDQITDSAMNMMKKGYDRIVVTLDPPNLGTLNMDVKVHNDTVTMLLVADNHDVQQILNSNLDQLKTALQGQGLSIDRFDVLVQDKQYNWNQNFQPGGDAQFEEGRRGRNNTGDDNASLRMLRAGEDELNEPSLGIISLFV